MSIDQSGEFVFGSWGLKGYRTDRVSGKRQTLG